MTDQQRGSAQRATVVRWVVMGLVAFAAASAYLTRHCLAAANTTIQAELELDDKQMGWILSSFNLGYLFFQVPGGWLGLRYGARFAFPLISVVWSLFSVLSSVSSWLVTFCATRFGLGVFQAGLTPISAKVVRDWMPPALRGMSSALITACMSIGGAFTMWYTGALLEGGHDWRAIFLAYSLVGGAWAMVFYAFFRNSPRSHWLTNDAECRLIEGSLAPTTNTEEAPELKAAEDAKETAISLDGTSFWRAVLRSPSMWGLSVQAFFRAAGSMAGGWVIDDLFRRTSSKRISRCGVALGSLTLCGALTLASAWADNATHLSIVMAAGAFFSGIGSPAAWAVTIDIGRQRTEIAMGVMNMAGCLAGVVLPIFLGDWFDEIKKSSGEWAPVIYLHAAFYFTAAAAWLFVRPVPLEIATSSETTLTEANDEN